MTMSTSTAAAPAAWKVWSGRVLSALPVLMLFFSASMKVSHATAFMEAWSKFGFPEGLATPIGIVEFGAAIIYAIPKTRVLGAILLSAYLGGAVVTHVRVGDPFVAPIVLGILVWAGLYLRDARVRELLPLAK